MSDEERRRLAEAEAGIPFEFKKGERQMSKAEKSIQETRELLDQKRGNLMPRYIRVILENQIVIMEDLITELGEYKHILSREKQTK